MFTDKTLARIIGALFIIATVTAIAGGSLLLILDEPSYVADVAANQSRVVTGVLLELMLVLSVVGIAAFFYPVLRRHNDALALSYVTSRTIEAVTLLVASLSVLPILALSDQSATEAPLVGEVLLASREWTYLIGSMALLGVGGLILYSVLYRSNLIPAWLSIWGLIAAGLILLRGLGELYGIELNTPTQAALAAPIGIQEMVMALWLIIKGFNTDGALAGRGAEETLVSV